MAKRRIAVTGASGFVGASLVRRLLDLDYSVVALVRPGSDTWRFDTFDSSRAEIKPTDLTSRQSVDEVFSEKIDSLIHCAAHGAYSFQTDTQQIIQVNVQGTMNILDASIEHGVHSFVNLGSSSEYGYSEKATSETDRIEPNSPYAISKAFGTHYCSHMAKSSKTFITTLRLYSVYGNLEDPRRLIPTLLRQAQENTLPQFASPNTARDFVYIEDVLDIITLASNGLNCASGEVFNVASGKQTTLKELAFLAKELFSIQAEPHFSKENQRSWDTDIWYGDISKIKSVLSWEPQISLKEGLTSTFSTFFTPPG